MKSWGSYYSSQTVETDEITVPRYGRVLMEIGRVKSYSRAIDYNEGRWVLIDTL